MKSFVKTNGNGQFVLDGKPWFYHGSTYCGRKPGYCGQDWIRQNFKHNLSLLPDDLAKMRDLNMNAVGLFIEGSVFFNGVKPDAEMFSRLDSVIDAVADSGLRAIIFPVTSGDRIPKDIWCKAHGIDPGDELWNPAVNESAAQSQIYSITHFARRYAKRPEVLGYMGRVGRFEFPGWDPPNAMAAPVRTAWHRWLKDRFKGDLALASELLRLEPGENDWNKIRLPAEMPENFSRNNPRSFEYGVMQHVLINKANARLNAAVKDAAPRQLTVTDMEGVEIPIGLINVLVPELATADAIWLECYSWEGMRGSQVTDTRHQAWLVEPNAGGKRDVDLLGNCGYVHMLVRWMQQSKKALIICHGVEVGQHSRGKHSEFDLAEMIDRVNAHIYACGAHGINYWCFLDGNNEREAALATSELPVPDADGDSTPPANTMNLLWADNVERPVCAVVRSTGSAILGKPPAKSPHETLVLFPTPIFQSLYRYRSNISGFGFFTSLARQGILADAAFTSAGEDLITLKRLTPYPLTILAVPEYHRDHPEIPDLLLQYVKRGGTLFLPLAHPEKLDDPYLNPRSLPALKTLSGVQKMLSRNLCPTLEKITSSHRSFVTDLTPSWTLAEEATFTRVKPVAGAEILAQADGSPLLYRHRLGKGSVYVFTWTMDVLLFRGAQLDYRGGHWDWLWQGLATELDLTQDVFNASTRTIRDMSYAQTRKIS